MVLCFIIRLPWVVEDVAWSQNAPGNTEVYDRSHKTFWLFEEESLEHKKCEGCRPSLGHSERGDSNAGPWCEDLADLLLPWTPVRSSEDHVQQHEIHHWCDQCASARTASLVLRTIPFAVQLSAQGICYQGRQDPCANQRSVVNAMTLLLAKLTVA